MCWSLSSVAWNFPKRPTHSRQSFCINAPVFLFQFWEETSLTGFLKFRLSALPNKFGKIKIFPAQSINIHYKQPPGSLKCVRYAATRKAISPLWKLIWSTSAYRCWHSQASTYPAGWSEFLFCLFFFPLISKPDNTPGLAPIFIFAKQLPAMVIDAELLVWRSLWLCEWPWFITEPHCIAGSLESICLNCTNTQNAARHHAAVGGRQLAQHPLGKLRPAWEETFQNRVFIQ